MGQRPSRSSCNFGVVQIKSFVLTYISDISFADEVMALGWTIRKSIWLRCAYTPAMLNGLENIVDDQTFHIIPHDLIFHDIDDDDVCILSQSHLIF